MKVLDLRCAQGHCFEGWFASGDAFDAQHERGLIECPLCANTDIVKLLSSPRLSLSGAKEPRALPTSTQPERGMGDQRDVALPDVEQLQAARWTRAVREVLSRTEDVGERFPEEARRMHYGETTHRGIRGRATREQAEALVDEGIEVMPLGPVSTFKQTLQ